MNVSPETGNYKTAKKTNEIMNAINGLNGQVISGVPNPLIADKHIGYASYFNSISNGLMSMRLLTKQCDACNSQCDATCDTCDACDTCDTGACYTCVACNSCNSVTTWSCSQWSKRRMRCILITFGVSLLSISASERVFRCSCSAALSKACSR